MASPPETVDAQQAQAAERWRSVYEDHLDDIERVVSWISRRNCLVDERAQDFRSWVHVRLIDHDFRILRAHRGSSRLTTYLVAVVQNLARDYKNRAWGRWRPSAAAERLGVAAVQLETLLERDGVSLDGATEVLRRQHGVRLSASEIAALAERLPRRTSAALEGGERVEKLTGGERTDERLRHSEGVATMDRARKILEECLAELELEDRLVLRMHYQSGLTLATIAKTLGLKQRRLYTRRDRCLRELRRTLEERGLDAASVLEALRWTGGDRNLDFGVSAAEPENLEPSNSSETRDTPPR